MTFYRVRRRWLIWLTFWVMGLAALAPTVSRALAASLSGGEGWVEVCTPSGVRWVRVAADASGAEAGQPASDTSSPDGIFLDHCPLCVLMGDRLAPASAEFAWAGSTGSLPEPAVAPAPDIPPSWSLAAPPRGPPRFTASSFA